MERLRIYTSNHLVPLVEHLARRLGRDPLPPLDDETIVVQSHGMARWLQLELARRQGIAASLRMPFPPAWARDLARQAGLEGAHPPDAPDPFDPTSLTWRLHERLAGLGDDDPVLAPVRTYLQGDDDGLKRYQLATRVAGCFATYQLYRPEMLVGWQREAPSADAPEAERWQAALWRALRAEAHDASPLAEILLELRDRLGSGTVAELPRRVTVFGAATLPPVLVELLAALAGHAEVAIYVVAPTRHYWSDLVSEDELERWKLREGAGADPDLEHLEVAHPLLGSMGRQGRDFAALLLEADVSGQAHEPLEVVEPDPRTVLGRLQADLLDLVDPGLREDKPRLDPADRSLRLHVCHSPMREMEVLREELLQAFDQGVAREPGDVLVLVPDMTKYAPYVRAVLGRPVQREGARPLSIPYRLADRHPADEQPFARVLLQLLSLAEGRRTASEILDLVEQEPVARCFGIDPVALPALRERVRAAGIHWGVDPEQRARDQGVPVFGGGSWREGLDRLLLGALTGPVESRVAGVLPEADATLARASLVASLTDAVEAIVAQLDALRGPHRLIDWVSAARQALLASTRPRDDAQEMERRDVLAALDELADRAERFATQALVGRPAFLESLRTALGDHAAGRGFISGSVTVAELRPMRSLPFRVIAVVGLDEGGFPRPDQPLGFDLVEAKRRRGDRNPRDDDRYLFLETLLAAGRRLILSTVGRSQLDNTDLAHSACVDELLETVDRTFVAAAVDRASQLVTVDHRLQPFHPDYAEPGSLERFTHDPSLAEAIAAGQGAPRRLPPFAQEPMAETGSGGPDGDEFDLATDEQGREIVILEHLLEFWKNPSRWFCRRRLGLLLRFEETLDVDDETLALDGLVDWQARDWLLERRRSGQDADAHERDLLPALVGLPPGEPGAVHARMLQREVTLRWETVRAGLEDLGARPVDVRGADWRLQGALHGLTTGGLFLATASKKNARDRLQAWIQHLAHCADASNGPCPPRTLLVMRDGTLEYGAVDDAVTVLHTLVDGFRAGRRNPLPFFPETSAAFEREAAKLEEEGASVVSEVVREKSSFRGAWDPSTDDARGECEDEAVRLCLRGRAGPEIFDQPFPSWARAIFGPLREAERAVKS